MSDIDSTETITIYFILHDGSKQAYKAKIGDTILDVARKYDIDLEGACEGSLACSTCHVVVDTKWYDILDQPSDDENDMLDLAFDLQNTSRLGCQIFLSKELDGLIVKLPRASRNL